MSGTLFIIFAICEPLNDSSKQVIDIFTFNFAFFFKGTTGMHYVLFQYTIVYGTFECTGNIWMYLFKLLILFTWYLVYIFVF